MDRINQGNGIFDGGLREYAMSEVEYMARPAGHLIEHEFCLFANLLRIGQQHRRVEVALNGPVIADRLPGVIESDPPVNSDHGGPRVGQQRQQCRISSRKIDDRNIGWQAGNDLLNEWMDKLVIIFKTQTPGPRVEQLNALGAGFDLAIQID